MGGCFGNGDAAAARGAEAETGSYARRWRTRGGSPRLRFTSAPGLRTCCRWFPRSRLARTTRHWTLSTLSSRRRRRVNTRRRFARDKDFGAATAFERTDGPLRTFLKCVVSTAKNLADKAGDRNAWGTFMLTDSPAVRAAVEREFVELDARVVVTDGAYGHVKFANSGVCSDGARTCDASDPRPVWERSMMDLYLVGRVDAVLMLYQSKFSVAAMMRGAVKHGQRELYENTRITHSLVDPRERDEERGMEQGQRGEEENVDQAVGPVRSGGSREGQTL